MSKVVKAAVMIVAAAVVIVAAPYIAAAIGSIAGALGASLSLAVVAGISSSIVAMGITMGLTAIAGMFRKTPNLSQSMADRLNTSVVPTAARKIVFGTTAGGQDVRFFEGDIDLPSTKKDGYVQVIALASHRISAFKQFYVENDLVWSNGAWLKHRGGFAPNNPLRFVTEGRPGNGFSIGTGRYWNPSATFTGCAYYVPFWKLDTDVWDSGIPSRLTAIIDGCPLYDPRRDSTRGGSGSHRIENQESYAFRDGSTEIGRNPALALLTYLLGWRINGTLVWGMGIPAHRIDFDNFRTYANLSEERVATQAGGTVQRYTLDGIYSTADSHETVINSITATMGSCKLTDRGGVYCLVGGYDDTAGPKVAFDADDLVAPANGSSPYVWNPAPTSRERFNIVRGRFANPDELFQLTDWGDPIEQPPLADGIPRTMSLDLGGVSRAETCQRIAKQFLLREYLTPGTFSASFGPKAFAAEVGSVMTLSLPAEGWNAKLFRVMEQAETHDMFFQMTLREEDPRVYAWDRDEKPLPPSIRPQGYDPKTTIPPENLQLTSNSYAGANDVHVSEVHVTWTPEMSGRVSFIQIQSRPAGTDAWTEQAGTFDPKIGRFTFTSNAPGITVEVQARYRMTSAVYSPWMKASVATAAVVPVAEWENIKDSSGTRPADNADVTGENTSKDTAAVGGVSASTVTNALKDNAGNIIGIREIQSNIATANERIKTAQDAAIKAGDDLAKEISDRDAGDKNLQSQFDTFIKDGANGDTYARSEINTLKKTVADEDKSLGERIDVVKSSVTRGGGNLLSNTDFATLDGWNVGGNSANDTLSRNTTDAYWRPGGVEDVLNVTQGPSTGNSVNYTEVFSDPFAVRPSAFYQFFVFSSSHRAPNWVTLFYYRTDGSFLGYAGEYMAPNRNNGGRDIAGWNQNGAKYVKVPADAVIARMVLRKYDTLPVEGTDSVAWFWHPYVGEASEGQKIWNAYVSGNAKAVQLRSDAEIKTAQRTGANAEQAVATLDTTVGTRFRGVNDALADYDTRITTVSNQSGSTVLRANTLEAQMRRETPSALNTFIDGVNGRIDSVNSTTVTNLNARIEERAAAYADDRAGAVAIRAATLEAQMRRETPSAINSYVDNVNGRIDSVNGTTVSNLNSRIEDRATAIADAKAGAVAQTVSTLRSEYNSTKSTVSTQAGTIATLEGRATSYWQVQSVANGNRAQITVRSDSNNGAGVDIVGDVNFSGNLNVGPDSGGNRMKLTNSGATVYDGNGTLRVRWGLW